MKMEAEPGARLPQATGHWEPAAAGRDKAMASQPSQGVWLLVLDFGPLQL